MQIVVVDEQKRYKQTHTKTTTNAGQSRGRLRPRFFHLLLYFRIISCFYCAGNSTSASSTAFCAATFASS